MQNLIKSGIGVLLKEIQYESLNKNKENKIDCVDNFEIVEIEPKIAEFKITRTVNVDLQIAYNIKIIVCIQVHAKEGVDLSKELTEEIINNNKKRLSGAVMGYMSALVTQITGSFNNYPIITAPSLKLETD